MQLQLKVKNSWIFFAPFLVLYTCIIYIFQGAALTGDEPRYLQFAQNLLHGFYSPKEELNLWNGPGYPLLIAPFIKLGLNITGLRLLNGVLQYASVVFLYQCLVYWVSEKKALVLSLFWACYYIAFKEMTYLYSECFANFLVCLFLYYSSKNLVDPKVTLKQFILLGIILGVLILTKVVFGYVIIAFAILLLIFYAVKKESTYLRFFYIAVVALLINIPYLFYTYQLTGKAFYWSNAGGMSLYWASTPIEGEYGDWNDAEFKAYCGYDSLVPCNTALFAKGHQQDYNEIYKYTGVARDEAFKQKAIKNIRQYPAKYFKNTIANIGRFFFGIPGSYQYMRYQNLWRILPNAIVFCIFLFSVVMSLLNIKKHPPLIIALLSLLFLYFAASIVVSALQRQLYVVLPLILVWFGWLTQKAVAVKLRF
ncbi:MAG: glycosyltransferase family 39 protein [Sediminibacterium sp.]